MRNLGGWVTGIGSIVLVGCSSGSSNDAKVAGAAGAVAATCTVGMERCDCYRNATCDDGLTCASGICVKLAAGGAAGAVDLGGASGAGSGSRNIEDSAGTGVSPSVAPSVSAGAPSVGSGGAYPVSSVAPAGIAGSNSQTSPQLGIGGAASVISTGGATTAQGGMLGLGGRAVAQGGVLTASGGAPAGVGGIPAVFGGAPTQAGAAAGGASSNGGGASSNPNRLLSPAQVEGIKNATCSAWNTQAKATPPKLVLIVDTSSSMTQPASGTGTSSKWEVMRDAVLESVCGVSGPGLDAEASVGLLLYPNQKNPQSGWSPARDVTACVNTGAAIPLAKLGNTGTSSHRTRLRDAFSNAQLGFGTPTADAYTYALNELVLTPEQLAISAGTTIILITDGSPTLSAGCYNPTGSIGDLDGSDIPILTKAGHDQGVNTFIIGLSGSERAKAAYSLAAYNGGTAPVGCDPNSSTSSFCHMDLTATTDLRAALQTGFAQITRTASGCLVDIPATMGDTAQTTDLSRMAPLLRRSDGTTTLLGRVLAFEPGCRDGYRVMSSTQIELCADTCAAMQADSAASIQLYFGCSAEELRGLGIN